VRSKVRTGVGDRAYDSAVDGVRRELAPVLRALETAAANPLALEQAAYTMPALQYALHTAGERVLGLEPLPGHEESHEELAAALAIAREDTADVAETLEESGAFAAAPLLWEWRAALFGVRLALARVEQPESPAPPRTGLLHAAWPVALLFAGVGCVLAGALVEVWPLWVVGLAFVAASTTLSWRRP
jgi:hypothetical protein